MTYRYQQSVFKCYRSDKHFSEFLPTRWRQKSAGTDMKQNYVTVTMYTTTVAELEQLCGERKCADTASTVLVPCAGRF